MTEVHCLVRACHKLFIVGLSVLVTPAAGWGQETACSEGVIARVDVVNHSIFKPSDIGGRKNEWAYHVVNRAHIRTKEGFIRRQILVEAGQCYDPLQVSESGRLLRELSFMARAEERSHQEDDGSWVVVFESWDEWTTLISINASVEDAFEFEGLYVEEKNLLGRGGQAVIEYHRFRERRDLGLKLLTRRFLGTLAEAYIIGGRTRNGYFLDQEIEYPFRGETGGVSFRGRLFFKDADRSFSTGDAEGISHVLLPLTERRLNLASLWRFGERGRRLILGVGLDVSHPKEDGLPRVAESNEYNELVTAPDSLAAGLGAQRALQSYARIGVTAGLRRMRFETRSGLDLVFGTQDVAIGGEALVTVGRTLGTWGTRGLGSFVRGDVWTGGATSWLVANVNVRGEGQLLDHAPTGEAPWRDVFISVALESYLRPPFLENHTIFGRFAFEGAWNSDDYRQFGLGGARWLRSLVDYQAPVSKRLVVQLEERWRIPGLPPAVDLGLSVFGDVGRGWSGDLPFSREVDWTAAVGGGIRLALPARSGNVFRIEMAWPVDGVGGSVFRVVKDRGRTGR